MKAGTATPAVGDNGVPIIAKEEKKTAKEKKKKEKEKQAAVAAKNSTKGGGGYFTAAAYTESGQKVCPYHAEEHCNKRSQCNMFHAAAAKGGAARGKGKAKGKQTHM